MCASSSPPPDVEFILIPGRFSLFSPTMCLWIRTTTTTHSNSLGIFASVFTGLVQMKVHIGEGRGESADHRLRPTGLNILVILHVYSLNNLPALTHTIHFFNNGDWTLVLFVRDPTLTRTPGYKIKKRSAKFRLQKSLMILGVSNIIQ